jgi:ESCRT-II complex subunit VPS22
VNESRCIASSRDDLARAIKKLRVLGGGFTVLPVGGRRLVQSIPGELNMDHTAVLQKAEVTSIILLPCYSVIVHGLC